MRIKLELKEGKVKNRVTGDTVRLTNVDKFQPPQKLLFDPRTRNWGLFCIRKQIEEQNQYDHFAKPIHPDIIKQLENKGYKLYMTVGSILDRDRIGLKLVGTWLR